MPVRENAQQLAPSKSASPDIYDDGHLRIEHKNYYVSCGGVPVTVRRSEFLILSRLARNPGRTVSAEELWSHTWGGKKPLNMMSLHAYIYTLRRKLEPYDIHIETMVHVGYRLISRRVQS
jgi:two-component system KDP operon response regulator KdpE